MEELTVQVSYLIPFISFRSKGCFIGFPVIKYTYVPCFKVALLCLFALCGLIVFMVYQPIAYSEPCQTYKMELLAKMVTSKELTSLIRRLKGFWMGYTFTECNVNYFARIFYILQYILGCK